MFIQNMKNQTNLKENNKKKRKKRKRAKDCMVFSFKKKLHGLPSLRGGPNWADRTETEFINFACK